MNQRENLLSLLRRQGYEFVPPNFTLCPSLVEEYRRQTGGELPYEDYFGMPWREVDDVALAHDTIQYRKYYEGKDLHPGTTIDIWGVAHEPGSKEAMHMTKMVNPLKGDITLADLQAYPFPRYARGDVSHQAGQVEAIHARGLAAVGSMQCTIWETAWYIRGMEDLMMDMMEGSELATYLLDKVTEQAVLRAQAYAGAGADIVYLGDDIGMQESVMMSPDLYREWLKPRLKTVVEAARAVRPDIIIIYHSCGYIEPFIDDFIEVGIDVLNPIQTECMDYHKIVAEYGDRLSFHGCIGTQRLMPFGSPAEIRETVFDCLDTMGRKGGMLVAPTHILEPEVPWENIMAYAEACKAYKP